MRGGQPYGLSPSYVIRQETDLAGNVAARNTCPFEGLWSLVRVQKDSITDLRRLERTTS